MRVAGDHQHFPVFNSCSECKDSAEQLKISEERFQTKEEYNKLKMNHRNILLRQNIQSWIQEIPKLQVYSILELRRSFRIEIERPH